jgi:hypothetical protein
MQDRIFVAPIPASAVHIDTVRLSHSYRSADLPPPDDLLRSGFEVKKKYRGDNLIHTAISKPYRDTSSEPQIFIVRSEYGYCGISSEFSVAKLVSGSGLGIQTDEDIECALDSLVGFICQKTGVEFDTATAKVNRFDVNADFPVGEERIRLYEEAASRPYSRLTPCSVGETTKYFSNKSQGYALYGKMAEVSKRFKEGRVSQDDVLAAEGLLRLERRLYNTGAVNRFAAKNSLQARAEKLLTTQTAHMLITEMVAQLRLDKEKFSMEARDELLIKYFGKKAPEKLGILKYRELFGEDFWKKLGWDKQMYGRKKKPIIEANLWDVSPAEALPALVIPSLYNNPTSLS